MAEQRKTARDNENTVDTDRLLQQVKTDIEKGSLSRFKTWVSSTTSIAASMKERIAEDLDGWQKIPLNIAFIGNSGSGKSSLINSMRGLTADDEGAAKVGSTETTTECRSYPYPRYKNLVMWDLPGVGTPNFPKADYLERIIFSRYDFFIIISQSRFSENDLWLAKEINAKDLNFYFVRTKIDNEVRDDRRAHPKFHNKEMLLDTIRRDCIDQLKPVGIEHPDVFLINSYDQGQYDFERFQLQLIKDAPARIKEAITLSFPALSPGVIEEKKILLQNRLWKVALIASFGSAIPIPGTGMACEIAAILIEAHFYCEQLGIDKQSLEDLAARLGVTADSLEVDWSITILKHLLSPVKLAAYLGGLALGETAEIVAKIVIPILGGPLSVGISYGLCVLSLQSLLGTCVEQALETRRRFNKWVADLELD